MVRPTSRVSKVLMTGPLAPFADAYALEFEASLLHVVDVSEPAAAGGAAEYWLEVRRLGVAELTGERVEEFLAFQRGAGRHRAQWSRPGLLCLLDVLHRLGLAAKEPVRVGLADGCAVGLLRALPACRARPGGWYCSWLRVPRSPVPGRVVAQRPLPT